MAQPELPMVWLDLFWMVNAALQLESPFSIFVIMPQLSLTFTSSTLFLLSCLVQPLIRNTNPLNITIFLICFFTMIIFLKFSCK